MYFKFYYPGFLILILISVVVILSALVLVVAPVEHPHPSSSSPTSSSTGLVPEQKNQVAQATRGGNGHGQEEARLRDGEDEGELGQRGGRRVQQTAGPKL